jgi:hypothetical protein
MNAQSRASGGTGPNYSGMSLLPNGAYYSQPNQGTQGSTINPFNQLGPLQNANGLVR